MNQGSRLHTYTSILICFGGRSSDNTHPCGLSWTKSSTQHPQSRSRRPCRPRRGSRGNCFSVHWVLGKGVVLHRLDLAFVSSGPLVDDVGVVHLEVVQLLLAEVDVQVPVKVVRGSRGEGLSIDIDYRLLAHVEPDHLVDALTSGGGHLLQDFLETGLAWLACAVDWEPIHLAVVRAVL